MFSFHSNDLLSLKRVWNSQILNYAGYRIDENTVRGDKAQVEFTNICIRLGWKAKYGEFDILPLVLQANGEDPQLFEIPPDLVMQVKITHPK
jgi:nitric oxide synthase oxygenase domain/subunit